MLIGFLGWFSLSETCRSCFLKTKGEVNDVHRRSLWIAREKFIDCKGEVLWIAREKFMECKGEVYGLQGRNLLHAREKFMDSKGEVFVITREKFVDSAKGLLYILYVK